MMPIYTVKAFDGKTLRVDAPDEATLEQAMQDYQKQATQPHDAETTIPGTMPSPTGNQPSMPTGQANSLQNTPSLPEVIPGQTTLTPGGEKGMRMVRDAVMTASPGGTLEDLAQLEGHYAQHPVRTALDALGLAGFAVPALGDTEAIGKGLAGSLAAAGGTQAALDAGNIQNPLIRAGATLAGGLAGGAGVGALADVNPLEGTPASRALTAAGGNPTAAQSMKPGSVGQNVASVLETMGRTNPLLSGTYSAIDQANANAVAAQARNAFGADILDPQSGIQTGNSLKAQLGQMADARAAAYGPVLADLKNAPGFPNYGKFLLSNLSDAVNNGNRTVTDSAKNAFMQAAQAALKGKTTPEAVDKALTDIQIRFASKFPGITGAPLNQLEGDFGYMMGQLKNAHYQALNNLSTEILPAGSVIGGTLGDDLRAAKGDYADASKAMDPLSKALAARADAPELVGQSILNSGSQAVQRLVEGSQNPAAIQRDLARSILETAKAPPDSAISGRSLASALNKYRNVLPALGQSGEDLINLAKVAKAAGQQDVGVINPSRTAITDLQVKHLGPWALAAGVPEAVYAKAGVPLVNAVRGIGATAPATIAEGAQGTNKALQALGIIH